MKKLIYLAAIAVFGLSSCKSSRNATDAGKKNSLTETYWKLTELNGKPVGAGGEDRREVYIILRNAEQRVQGNAGCNGYGGNYILDPNGFNLKFSGLMHTQMACPGLDIEIEYLKALEMTDSYYVKDGTLQLNRGRMAPLAKFTAVAGKAESLQ
ncbi:MAG: META domain-containing protein [Chitinophagaceae bacterium]|nr:MAG: META domain-containing protein [Chitinophagaceae bacterium]